MVSSQVTRLDEVTAQLGKLRAFIVAWKTMDLVSVMDTLNAFLSAADLIVAEVADLRESLDAVRVELDAHAKAIAGLEGKS